MVTIASLRKLSYRVRVNHFRRDLFGRTIPAQHFKIARKYFPPDLLLAYGLEESPKGGVTVVAIEKDGKEAIGRAESKTDPYIKKEGVRIALERALKEFDTK